MGYDPLLQLLHPDDALDAVDAVLERGAAGVFNVVPRADQPADGAAPGGEGGGAGPAPPGLLDGRPAVGLGPGRGAGRLPRLRPLPLRGRRRKGARELGFVPRHDSRDALLAYLRTATRRPWWRRRRRRHAHEREWNPGHGAAARGRPGAPELERLRRERDRLGRAVERARGELEILREASARAAAAPEREGLLVAARLAQSGMRGLTLQGLGRLQRALYFAWHSEQVDEFGHDPASRTRCGRCGTCCTRSGGASRRSGLEHVPSAGPGLVVANHSGVLPYDGAMVKLAVRLEHPAQRDCRMLMLDMFALLPFLAPLLTKPGESAPIPTTPSGCCARASWWACSRRA